MSLPYNKNNVPLARENRSNPTRQENHLWYDFLSKYHVRFQRQKPIDEYIADFYCHKAKLVIEVDGSQHYTPEGIEKDRIRTERLEEYDLLVIRIPNKQIDKNFYGVCNYIDRIVTERLEQDLAES